MSTPPSTISEMLFQRTTQGNDNIRVTLLYRWAVFDLEIEKGDGSKARKIVFYSYVPDTYSGMDKLFFSAAKDPITKSLEGVARSIQVIYWVIMLFIG